MKRIRLSLTGIGEVLKESAEKKLENENSIPRCDAGHTREFYEDLNVPEHKFPKELLEREKGTELQDDDFEAVTSDILLYEDQIKVMVTDDEFTTIFLNDGLTITVLETVEEIDFYLDFIHRSWVKKIKDSVYFFFRRIKWKLKGYKQVDYQDIINRPENQPDYIAPKEN